MKILGSRGLVYSSFLTRFLLIREIDRDRVTLALLTTFSHHNHPRGDTAIDDHEPTIVKRNNDAIDQCEKLYPGIHHKPASPRVKCLNDATLAYYAGFAENQRSGLARAFANKMTAIAKKYDGGQISDSEFDTEKEEAITDFTSQITQRPDSNQAPVGKQATLLPKQLTCVPISSGVNCY